jgi:hypothetical protein
MQHHPESLIAERLQETPDMIAGIAVGEIQSDLADTQFLQLPDHVGIDRRVFGSGYADAGEISRHMMAGNRLIASFRA